MVEAPDRETRVPHTAVKPPASFRTRSPSSHMSSSGYTTSEAPSGRPGADSTPATGGVAAHAAPPLLRIREWMPGVRGVLGPGTRTVVWVQGCSLHCPGCMVPETWAARGGRLVEPAALADEVLAAGACDGVTVSGGEPMEQPGPVADFVARVRAAGRDVWVYSGYTLEELLARNDADVDRVLSLTDVLVDGRYEHARPGASAYRGSSNQRLVPLTGRALPPPNTLPPRVQLTLDAEGRLVVVGVPPPGFLPRFRDALERRGLRVQTNRW